LGSTVPPYNQKEVLQSSAGIALATAKPAVGAVNILQPRKQATVTRRAAHPAGCRDLMDLSDEHSVAEHLREMKELTELLRNYIATLVSQFNQPHDPFNADPARFNIF
jgi:hypothetical protein